MAKYGSVNRILFKFYVAVIMVVEFDDCVCKDFLEDYARWRHWEQAVVFATSKQSSNVAMASLSRAGVLAAGVGVGGAPVPLSVPRHRLGAVLDVNHPGADALLADSQGKVSPYVSWLLLARDSGFDIEDFLRDIALGPDSDLVVAISKSNCDGGRPGSARSKRCKKGDRVFLYQAYKLRSDLPSSLVVNALGIWDDALGIKSLTSPRDVERRLDLRGITLIVGVKNLPRDVNRVGHDVVERVFEDLEQETNLLEIIQYICNSLNARLVTVPGERRSNGSTVSANLLESISKGVVDLGLRPIATDPENAKELTFSISLLLSIRSLYFLRSDSGGKDIFLAPFSPRLLACVVGSAAILGLAVVLINSCQKSSWNFGDTLVWSVSVLTMQGSPWNPRSLSGCMMLMSSLIFALIIYNAYAAFITSVLSVQSSAINSMDDFFNSDLDLGYVSTVNNESSGDDLYLRNANEATLRLLYARGKRRPSNVADAVTGVHRVADGGFAFFAVARLARSALKASVAPAKRCEVQELAVEASRRLLAFPMTRRSPYRRLINLCLLRMRETGVLARVTRFIYPSMPHCEQSSVFKSARLSDVYSAFFVLALGFAAGVFLGVVEITWRRKGRHRKIK